MSGRSGAEEPWDQRLARRLVRPLAASPISPNHVTAFSLATGLAAAVCYGLGGRGAHWGGLLIVVSMLADHADGELARMSGRTSRFGHYFDYVSDGVVTVALFVGIGVGLRGSALGWWAVPLGLAAGLTIAAIFLLRDEVWRRRGKEAIAQPSWAGFEIQDVLYLVAPITWLGGLMPFLAAAGVGAPLFLLWQTWDVRRGERRRAGGGRPVP